MLRRPLAFAALCAMACHPGTGARADSTNMEPMTTDSGGTIDSVYRFLSNPSVPGDSVTAVRSRLPYDSISLRREPCFGTCPIYEATLYRDGRARYVGTRFVERVGTWRGEVSVQDYARLAYLLDKLGFMALPDSFAATYTDQPGATLTAHRSPGGTKSVSDYGYVGPVELWALREIFDGILARVAWEKTNSE
ncbi:MAG: DUF6438 domain-containing protein [Gemmatimonadota bacterium]